MLVLESHHTPYYGGRLRVTSPAQRARACAASTSLSKSRKTPVQGEAEVLNASCCNFLKDISLKSQSITNPPAFLQAFVSRARPSDKRKLSSSTDGGRQASVGGAEERDERETQLTSSAPSTSATATADASAKAVECTNVIANEAKATLLSSTAMHPFKTSLVPSKDEMDEAKEATVVASASSPACATTPWEGASPFIRRRSPVVGAADRRELVALRHRPRSGPSNNPKRQSTSDALQIDALMQKGGSFDTCNTAAADLPIARLATALAASSLRLTAAAEEGLESSPPQSKACWWGIGGSTAARKSSQDGAVQRVSPEKPPDPYFQQETRKALPCCSRVPSAFTPVGKMRQTRMKSASASASPACTVGHTAVSLSQRDAQRCIEGSISQAASSTSSESCRSCRQRREERARFLRTPASSPNIRGMTPSNPLLIKEHMQAGNRLPVVKPPSPLSQKDQVQVKQEACSSSVTSAPEEEQFCLLLQHYMGLLKREAARCFASSQASTKQKLWGELQQERLLRLQEQQEHQAAAATAAAELEFLRANRDGNRSRTERLLEISCSRKTADDDSRLLVCAWRAWLQHRWLVRKRKQVEKLSQQRRLLLLLLRTFLPWRAAASECRAERQQRRAQRLMQQELQRLEQIHLEGKSRQQQQLLQLHQQLAAEIWLRECLQQSLVGVVAGATVGNLTRSEARGRSSAEAGVAMTASRALLKTTQKKNPRDQKSHNYLPTRRESPLAVFGMHANPKGREASVRQLKQHQHLEREQSLHRQRQEWATQVPAEGASGSDSGSVRSQLGPKSRRVKFVDENLNLQHNQQLLLLASLLAMNGDKQNLQIPVDVSNLEENPSRLISSAFAPPSKCEAVYSKDLASALAANKAKQARYASGTFRPLQHGAEPLGGNIVQERAADQFTASSLRVDGQLPKGRRWTAATQFLYPS
ncbi:hypothetical protein Esti_003781 [Eimeria stiedai]